MSLLKRSANTEIKVLEKSLNKKIKKAIASWHGGSLRSTENLPLQNIVTDTLYSIDVMQKVQTVSHVNALQPVHVNGVRISWTCVNSCVCDPPAPVVMRMMLISYTGLGAPTPNAGLRFFQKDDSDNPGYVDFNTPAKGLSKIVEKVNKAEGYNILWERMIHLSAAQQPGGFDKSYAVDTAYVNMRGKKITISPDEQAIKGKLFLMFYLEPCQYKTSDEVWIDNNDTFVEIKTDFYFNTVN